MVLTVGYFVQPVSSAVSQIQFAKKDDVPEEHAAFDAAASLAAA